MPIFFREIPEKLIYMAWYSPGGTNFNTSYPGDSGKIIDLKVPWFLSAPLLKHLLQWESLQNPHCGSDNALKDCNMLLQILKYPYKQSVKRFDEKALKT